MKSETGLIPVQLPLSFLDLKAKENEAESIDLDGDIKGLTLQIMIITAKSFRIGLGGGSDAALSSIRVFFFIKQDLAPLWGGGAGREKTSGHKRAGDWNRFFLRPTPPPHCVALCQSCQSCWVGLITKWGQITTVKTNKQTNK